MKRLAGTKKEEQYLVPFPILEVTQKHHVAKIDPSSSKTNKIPKQLSHIYQIPR